MVLIKPHHVFALAWMGSQVAWAVEGANVSSGFFNSSLAPFTFKPTGFVSKGM